MDTLHRVIMTEFYDRISAMRGRQNKNVERNVTQLKRDMERAADLPPGTLDEQGPARDLARSMLSGILDGSIAPITYHKIQHNGSKTMFIMIGTTGAGKSTYAERLAQNTGAAIVSSNVYKSSRPRIDKAVTNVVSRGQSVIVNATHPTRERRQELAAIARAHGMKTRCIHLDVPKSVAQKRSKLHTRDPKGRTVYFVGAKFFKNFEAPGSECDKYNVITNAGIQSQGGGGALERSNSLLGVFQSNTKKRPHPNANSAKKRPRLNANNVNRPPEPMLAHHYNAKKHKGAYYVSEKLDGIRAIFYKGRLYTRNHKLINAPQWFLDKIPAGTYDGELYGGPGIDQFHSTSSIVMGQASNPGWEHIQYRVFDDWNSTNAFSKTYERLAKKLPLCSARTHQPICLEDHRRMNNHNAIHRMFTDITGRRRHHAPPKRPVPKRRPERIDFESQENCRGRSQNRRVRVHRRQSQVADVSMDQFWL